MLQLCRERYPGVEGIGSDADKGVDTHKIFGTHILFTIYYRKFYTKRMDVLSYFYMKNEILVILQDMGLL